MAHALDSSFLNFTGSHTFYTQKTAHWSRWPSEKYQFDGAFIVINFNINRQHSSSKYILCKLNDTSTSGLKTYIVYNLQYTITFFMLKLFERTVFMKLHCAHAQLDK